MPFPQLFLILMLLLPLTCRAELVNYQFQTAVGPGSMPAPPFDVDAYGFSREAITASFVVDTAAPGTFGQYWSYFNGAVVSWSLFTNDGVLNVAGSGGNIGVDRLTGGYDTIQISGLAPLGTTQFGPFSVFSTTIQLVGLAGDLNAFYQQVPQTLPDVSLADRGAGANIYLQMTDGTNYRTSSYIITSMSASPVPIPAAWTFFGSSLCFLASCFRMNRYANI